jgi:hypothetical protein
VPPGRHLVTVLLGPKRPLLLLALVQQVEWGRHLVTVRPPSSCTSSNTPDAPCASPEPASHLHHHKSDCGSPVSGAIAAGWLACLPCGKPLCRNTSDAPNCASQHGTLRCNANTSTLCPMTSSGIQKCRCRCQIGKVSTKKMAKKKKTQKQGRIFLERIFRRKLKRKNTPF